MTKTITIKGDEYHVEYGGFGSDIDLYVTDDPNAPSLNLPNGVRDLDVEIEEEQNVYDSQFRYSYAREEKIEDFCQRHFHEFVITY